MRVLLRAFATLSKNEATLAIVGPDGGMRRELERLAGELSIAGRVRFTGPLDDALYVSALTACDVFVLPSEFEAFGIVALEAMACGKPAVATRVGGLPEVVEEDESGLLVPYGDDAALAGALARILDDRALASRFGARGRERAGRFDWREIVAATEDLYSSFGA